MEFQEIFIASDHAGFDLKNKIFATLKSKNFVIQDFGPQTSDRCDYPDFADLVSKNLKQKKCGILICGSGQGMSMRANKYKDVRAALVWSEEISKLAREHNDANVICLGARFFDLDNALKMINIFLNTKFEGGRHADRVKKISCQTL